MSKCHALSEMYATETTKLGEYDMSQVLIVTVYMALNEEMSKLLDNILHSLS